MTKAEATFQAFIFGVQDHWLEANQKLERAGRTTDYRLGQAFVNHLYEYLDSVSVSDVLDVSDPFYNDDKLAGFLDAVLAKFNERWPHTD